MVLARMPSTYQIVLPDGSLSPKYHHHEMVDNILHLYDKKGKLVCRVEMYKKIPPKTALEEKKP